MKTRRTDIAKPDIFRRQPWIAILALIAATGWGWAYPLIKMGFVQFGIEAGMTGSKILFAGVRFTLAGLILLAISWRRGFDLRLKDKGSMFFVLLYALLNTTLHYTCFYLGLSCSAGSRAAILNSLGTFLVVILACVFFKSDRMTWRKAIGCIVGFTGIAMLNIGGFSGEQVSLAGDVLIILNTLCGASSNLMTRSLGKKVNIFVGTGYGLALGGVLLIIPGLAMGGTLPQVTWAGCGIMTALVAISAVGFAIYNKLLSCNPMGKVAIYNSLIPVVGALTSCLCLGEPFYWKYAISGLLAATGIYIINRGKA